MSHDPRDSSNRRYELPLNERTRNFIRTQQLFQRIQHALQGSSPWDIHHAVMLVLDLYDISARSDIKRDLLKELERQSQSLRDPRRAWLQQEIDLEAAIAAKAEVIDQLYQQRGRANQHLKISQFLTHIRQRRAATSTLCTCDLSLYDHWLQRDIDSNRQQLIEWLQPYRPIQTAIDNILCSIRHAGRAELRMARDGYFQAALDGSQPMQMIQIELGAGYEDIYPEISAGKLRVSIRFIQYVSPDANNLKTDRDIAFGMYICEL